MTLTYQGSTYVSSDVDAIERWGRLDLAVRGLTQCAHILPEGRQCWQGPLEHLHGPETIEGGVVAERCEGRHHAFVPVSNPRRVARLFRLAMMDTDGS